MGRDILMICTTGTSASYLKSCKSLDEKDDASILQAILSIPGKDGERVPMIELMSDPQGHHDAMNDANFGGSQFFPSAELQTILRWLKDKAHDIDRLKVIMLPSQVEDSIFTAKVTLLCLEHLHPLYSNITLIDGETIPLPLLVDNREDFLSTVANLFGKFDELIEREGSKGREVIICSTGGFKSVAGFAMLYAQLHSLPCLYSFEKKFSEAYEVMSLPLGYAYARMDEEINMLKAIHSNAAPNTEALPQWVKDSKQLAGALLDSYNQARVKPYGTGEYLFNRLRECRDGDEWADYLQNLLVKNWANLWLGDQIPETVEHSRRHSKRLMELAASLFRCAGDRMQDIGFTRDDPKPLALLIASIYLHDIGHTALSYPVLAPDDSIERADIFPLGLFPSAVRELHHLLTGEVLGRTPERYFGERNPKREVLERFVPLIAAHHRGYTVLAGGETSSPKKRIVQAGYLLFGEEKFTETLRPLQDRAEGAEDVQKLLWVTALLRILDGCDVQSDRVISPEYLDYRNKRSADEARMVRAELEGFMRFLPAGLREKIRVLDAEGEISGIYEDVFAGLTELKEEHRTWRKVQAEALPKFMALSLANRLAFKKEQHNHFSKHKCIRFVLPSMNEKDNTITINVFPNDEVDGYTEAALSISDDIRKEYEAVKEVLRGFPEFLAEPVGGRA
ncbi:MAG: hypothetical protein IJT02_09965 [Synergistaceae bacterium]|nr:hypothetical protein [Synergistaceae bacterium]